MTSPKKNLKRDSADHLIAACNRKNSVEELLQHCSNSNDPKEAEGIRNSKKLMDLNDDCLNELLKYLNVSDLINLCGISNRFHDLIGPHIEKMEFSFSKFRKMFSLTQAEFMLSRFGCYIKRLKCRQRSNYYFDCHIDRQYYDLFFKYCPNIEELDYDFKSENGLNPDVLLAFKNKLKVLKIGHYRLNDEQCSVIGKLSRLEVLDFKQDSEITGKHLMDLRNLKNLNIYNCLDIKSEFFIQLCLQNRLKILSVNFLYLDDTSVEILNQSGCLTYLEFNYYSGLNDTRILAKLKVLRGVKIVDRMYGNYGGKELLQRLARWHFDTLEVLHISYCKNSDMFNEELEIILKFKNLKDFLCSKSLRKEYLYKLVGNLPNLESLYVITGKKFSSDDFFKRFPNIKDCKLKWELAIYGI